MKGIYTVLYKDDYEYALRILYHDYTHTFNPERIINWIISGKYPVIVEHINMNSYICGYVFISKEHKVKEDISGYCSSTSKYITPKEYASVLDEVKGMPLANQI